MVHGGHEPRARIAPPPSENRRRHAIPAAALGVRAKGTSQVRRRLRRGPPTVKMLLRRALFMSFKTSCGRAFFHSRRNASLATCPEMPGTCFQVKRQCHHRSDGRKKTSPPEPGREAPVDARRSWTTFAANGERVGQRAIRTCRSRSPRRCGPAGSCSDRRSHARCPRPTGRSARTAGCDRTRS